MTSRRYFRGDVVFEPLVDRWHAWSHIVAPASAALHVANRHVRLLHSYLEAPELHAEAVRDPSLRGGPFVDLPRERIEDVRALLERTVQQREPQLTLAAAISQAQRLIRGRDGTSLEPLYSALPPPLHGYVELVYDLHNNASLRFLEPLLYASKYYDTSAQTLMLSLADWRDRPFMLNTPRLDDADCVHASVPFADPAIDALLQSQRTAASPDELAERLQLPPSKVLRFREFFSDAPPPPPEPAEPGTVRWRYFGHACVLIESAGRSILIDPVVCYEAGGGERRYSALDLPAHIDYVLITHGHQDHLILEMLLQLRHRIGTIVVPASARGALQDPSMKLLLQQLGFKCVREFGVLDTIEMAGGCIVGLPFMGEHADLDIGAKLAYLVRIGRRSFMFAADARNLQPQLYENVRRSVGPIDTLFIGLECDGAPMSWIYGALLPTPPSRSADQSRRTSGADCEQALAMARTLGCRSTYVYAMGQEPWLNYISRFRCEEDSLAMIEAKKFIAACRQQGILAERLYGAKEVVLDPTKDHL